MSNFTQSRGKAASNRKPNLVEYNGRLVDREFAALCQRQKQILEQQASQQHVEPTIVEPAIVAPIITEQEFLKLLHPPKGKTTVEVEAMPLGERVAEHEFLASKVRNMVEAKRDIEAALQNQRPDEKPVVVEMRRKRLQELEEELEPFETWGYPVPLSQIPAAIAFIAALNQGEISKTDA